MIRLLVVCSVILSLSVPILIKVDTAAAGLQGSTSSRAKSVDELYNRNCARCHGPDGRGDTPLGHVFNAPDFTDAEWWRKNSSITSTKSLRSIITRGKRGMPSFGKKLTRAQINLLVNRVRRFSS